MARTRVPERPWNAGRPSQPTGPTAPSPERRPSDPVTEGRGVYSAEAAYRPAPRSVPINRPRSTDTATQTNLDGSSSGRRALGPPVSPMGGASAIRTGQTAGAAATGSACGTERTRLPVEPSTRPAVYRPGSPAAPADPGALRALRTLRPGQPGTKKLLRQFGSSLLCVRYRYDDLTRRRYTTVELVVDAGPWEERGTRHKGSAPPPVTPTTAAPLEARPDDVKTPPPERWTPGRAMGPQDALVGVKIRQDEPALQKEATAAGGFVCPDDGLWYLRRWQVKRLGLASRIVKDKQRPPSR